jgi:hypothetical protein
MPARKLAPLHLANIPTDAHNNVYQYILSRPAHSDTRTPVGDGSVEVGDKVFPWQGFFPLSSHTCLAWEALFCRPASPLSLLVTTCLPYL